MEGSRTALDGHGFFLVATPGVWSGSPFGPGQTAVELIGANSRWDHAGERYWEGEVEECINGRIVADGAYFGADISTVVDRLVGQRLSDGGWNCERANGSVRSSFATTINVLEGLLEFERATGGSPDSREARKSGEEYLLERGLFRRLSTGEPADEQFLSFLHTPGPSGETVVMRRRRSPRPARTCSMNPRNVSRAGGTPGPAAS